jgi:hypothetical protein
LFAAGHRGGHLASPLAQVRKKLEDLLEATLDLVACIAEAVGAEQQVSRTVISPNSPRPSCTMMMPSLARWCVGSAEISRPLNLTLPSLAMSRDMARRSVVFPRHSVPGP